MNGERLSRNSASGVPALPEPGDLESLLVSNAKVDGSGTGFIDDRRVGRVGTVHPSQ